ncbi:MAG: hypothetical protein WDW38_001714 [Sanguina aurantia]
MSGEPQNVATGDGKSAHIPARRASLLAATRWDRTHMQQLLAGSRRECKTLDPSPHGPQQAPAAHAMSLR